MRPNKPPSKSRSLLSTGRCLSDEPLGSHGAATRRAHFPAPRAGVHVAAHRELHLETLAHRALLRRAAPHRLEQRLLARRDGIAPGLRHDHVGYTARSAQGQRKLRAEGNRPHVSMQLRQQTVEEAVAIVVPRGALSEFDVILRFEVAAAEVARPGERHESQLARLPQRLEP